MRAVALAALSMAVGCYGGLRSLTDDAAEGDGGDGADDGADDGGDGVESQCGERSPGASPIRRLTAWEYDATIADLLGDDSHPSEGFPQEGGSGFDNNADVSSVTWLMANKYMLAAEAIAERAVADLPGLLSCDAATDGCVEGWIESFGPRAWRRPLTPDELASLVALYEGNLAAYDTSAAVSLTLQAMLQSPYFLYRVELGVPGESGEAAVPLDDWEMASRLSYFLWGSMPDEALFSAAASGALSSRDEIEAQARRMLDDPRARRMVSHFYEQWLGYHELDFVDKDTAMFAGWTPEIAQRQRAEAEAFLDHVMFDDDATLQTLLTAPYTFADAELASWYGLPAPDATGKVTSDDIELSGILSLGGVLSVHSKTNSTNPIGRGLFVREQLLCTIPPPPPDDVDIVPPTPDPNATTREQYEQHREDPACAGCHVLFDPVGFGFEHYDATGRWRTTENGFDIDASGELAATDVDGDFVGARELGERLAGSEQVAGCVARQWFRFAYGRSESEELDACNLETIDAAFAESGHDMRELLVALTQTDAFLFRTAYADEGGE
jgi:hypothetical protein